MKNIKNKKLIALVLTVCISSLTLALATFANESDGETAGVEGIETNETVNAEYEDEDGVSNQHYPVGTIFKDNNPDPYDSSSGLYKVTKEATDTEPGEVMLIGYDTNAKRDGFGTNYIVDRNDPANDSYIQTSIAKKLSNAENKCVIVSCFQKEIPSGTFAKYKNIKVNIDSAKNWSLIEKEWGDDNEFNTKYFGKQIVYRMGIHNLKKYEKKCTIRKNAFKNSKNVVISIGGKNAAKRIKIEKGAFKGVKKVHIEMQRGCEDPEFTKADKKAIKKLANAIKAAGAKKVTYQWGRNGEASKLYKVKAKKKK